MVKSKMTKEEQKWMAQDDAQIMARYQEIIKDKTRMNRAVKEAQSQANDLQKRANIMKNVSKTRKGSKNGK